MDVDAMRERNQRQAEQEAEESPAPADQDAAPIGDAIEAFHERTRSRSASPPTARPRANVEPDAVRWAGASAFRSEPGMNNGVDNGHQSCQVEPTAMQLFAEAVGADQTRGLAAHLLGCCRGRSERRTRPPACPGRRPLRRTPAPVPGTRDLPDGWWTGRRLQSTDASRCGAAKGADDGRPCRHGTTLASGRAVKLPVGLTDRDELALVPLRHIVVVAVLGRHAVPSVAAQPDARGSRTSRRRRRRPGPRRSRDGVLLRPGVVATTVYDAAVPGAAMLLCARSTSAHARLAAGEQTGARPWWPEAGRRRRCRGAVVG